MAWNRIQASRLLTSKEMTLFEGSLGDHAPQMSDKELEATIRRVRTQRDKYQDLLRRQRVSTRDRSGTKSGPTGVSNARTDQKAQVFSEALGRLENQRARRDRSADQHKARPTAGAPERKTTVRSAVRAAVEAKSGSQRGDTPERSAKAPAQHGPKESGNAAVATQAPATVPHAMRVQAMGQQRPLAHIAARGRRKQAGRDAR